MLVFVAVWAFLDLQEELLSSCGVQASSVHGIFQTRIQEWVAISFSKEIPSLAEEGIEASNGLSHFAIVPQTGVGVGCHFLL